MSISYKNRRRISLLLMLVGLTMYIILAVNLVSLFERPSIVVELVIYLGLGIIWAFPFKFIFKGIGQAEPDHKE